MNPYMPSAKIYGCLIGVLFLISSAVCFPHPLGNFSINRYSRIEPGLDELKVYYVVDMAEIPTLQEKGSIDTDQDGQISVRESAEYLTQKAAELPLGLKVIVNKKPIHLEVRSKDITINSERLALPTLRIELELFAPLPESPPTVTWEIIYEDRNYSQRLGWKEIIARAGPSMKIKESNVPQKDLSNALKSYPEKMLNTPPDAMNARIIVVPGTIDAPVLTSESSSAADVTTWEDRFIRLIKAKELTPRIYLIAFLISVGLGAMHALSPGHGKSIVAAYLIGSHGTIKHAIFLGMTVTLTHTIGVFALGFITLFASRYILPEKLYPWLGLVSGVIVVIIGVAMLIKRLQAARYHYLSAHKAIHSPPQHDHCGHLHQNPGHIHHHHNHNSDHDHHHRSKETVYSHTHHTEHAGHSHNHQSSAQHHGNSWKASLFHHHNHDHDHGHTHLPPGENGTPVTWRSLLALGISGGILPCPSALVVLLAAISLQRIGFGMILILAFSIGLAAVLTAIGLMFVRARQLLDRVPKAGPVTKILPVASALVIMVLGIGITVNALAQVL